MNKTVFFLCVIFFFAFNNHDLYAQTETKAQQQEKADIALHDHEYKLAYELFDKLHAKYPKEFDYKFKLAFCCLHYPEKKARAIELFEDIRKKHPGLEADYYLGCAYHINYKFEEAMILMQPVVDKVEKNAEKMDKDKIGRAHV